MRARIDALDRLLRAGMVMAALVIPFLPAIRPFEDGAAAFVAACVGLVPLGAASVWFVPLSRRFGGPRR